MTTTIYVFFISALAEAFHSYGCKVVLAGRNSGKLQELKTRLENKKVRRLYSALFVIHDKLELQPSITFISFFVFLGMDCSGVDAPTFNTVFFIFYSVEQEFFFSLIVCLQTF